MALPDHLATHIPWRRRTLGNIGGSIDTLPISQTVVEKRDEEGKVSENTLSHYRKVHCVEASSI